MNSAIQNNLTKVPETMLIPLRARYNETKRPHGIIRDPKSVEILDRIEPFFEGRREVSILSQMGGCAYGYSRSPHLAIPRKAPQWIRG